MGRYSKPSDLYKAQKKRFDQIQVSAQKMHEEIAQAGYQDYMELTLGEPTGKARIKLLRALGNPYGRGANAAESTADGRRRGSSRAARKKAGMKGEMPFLPIGIISGRLRRSIRKRKISSSPQRFAVGAVNPGNSGYVLLVGGTRKMVGRGLETEIRKRFRARNKAFFDHLKSRQQSTP